ncbi:hypothetical protein RFI_26692 [Reticulomyxa filosa]|uniref:Uncharacterized protein n=1 Tax=Reticulomyxa filosa TaxID=46433 RepID=X6MCB8_RETFI|nr:hypothetical protein RFI_26692 [Reticulomyxa filosa]|eukprot:ETO10685.1 hypothetical protein RFI_26692 [Reticulomyxa filosa]
MAFENFADESTFPLCSSLVVTLSCFSKYELKLATSKSNFGEALKSILATDKQKSKKKLVAVEIERGVFKSNNIKWLKLQLDNWHYNAHDGTLSIRDTLPQARSRILCSIKKSLSVMSEIGARVRTARGLFKRCADWSRTGPMESYAADCSVNCITYFDLLQLAIQEIAEQDDEADYQDFRFISKSETKFSFHIAKLAFVSLKQSIQLALVKLFALGFVLFLACNNKQTNIYILISLYVYLLVPFIINLSNAKKRCLIYNITNWYFACRKAISNEVRIHIQKALCEIERLAKRDEIQRPSGKDDQIRTRKTMMKVKKKTDFSKDQIAIGIELVVRVADRDNDMIDTRSENIKVGDRVELDWRG